MNPSPASAEAVFARAIELPAGAQRVEFVGQQCVGDAALRHEVESLLRAHDEAGDFLLIRAEQKTKPTAPAAPVSPRQTTVVNAAGSGEPARKVCGWSQGSKQHSAFSTQHSAKHGLG